MSNQSPPSVVLVGSGSHGDVNPLIDISLQLKQSEITPIILTNDVYRDQINDLSIKFISTGSASEYEKSLRLEESNPSSIRYRNLFQEYIVPTYLREYVRTRDLLKTIPKPLVASPARVNGAMLASLETNTKYLKLTLSPCNYEFNDTTTKWLYKKFPNESINSRLKRSIFGYKTKYHMYKQVEWMLKIIHNNTTSPNFSYFKIMRFMASNLYDEIGLFPEWLLNCTSSNPEPTCGALGFTNVMDPPMESTLPNKIQNFLKKFPHPIIFTCGTNVKEANKFFSDAEVILKKLERPGIFLSKHQTSFSTSFDQILKLNYTPLRPLLLVSDAIIHHGGIGTCAEALYAGIPQYIRPVEFDQFDNARRLSEIGVAMSQPASNFDINKAVNDITYMLSNTPTKDSISCYSKKTRESNSLNNICNHIVTSLER
ncbi:glycosyltransferase [Gilvimarinus sp. SDUM040013]|uniref:Glycosyltransferase n=1 Tax=Gilvimarinus gilvus TaxID=3058038 RepID=A0ABU4S0L9_9GAMM|nr:nucleotide disphospho-sugar-binding domain-containing protein [Gilvimarinus sp. SDUM040013]MDO3386005.1 glycosyltransferase [Gilvimarinus sp. SDUM040013]MDX6850459.1 glycosyltransferase [Gilvimarinus sp. SDUM040013]